MSVKKLLLIFLPLIIVAGLIWYFFFRSDSVIKRFDPVKPSQDQIELIESFGYPDTFTLIMEDESRYEVWTYYDMERSFIFWNGEFVEDQIVEVVSEELQFPDFRPTQFKSSITIDKIKKILGGPTVEADISSSLIENAKVYDYWDQVKVGTKDGKVTYVETLPVFVPEQFRISNEE